MDCFLSPVSHKDLGAGRAEFRLERKAHLFGQRAYNCSSAGTYRVGLWNMLGCVLRMTEAWMLMSDEIDGGQSSHCWREDTGRTMAGFSDLTGFAVCWGKFTVLIRDVSQP